MSTATIKPVADQIRQAFPFNVEKFPLNGPDNMRTPHYGLFRSDDSQCVGIACAERYTPHTTDDVIALAEAATSAFDGEANARCHFHNGHYVSIEPSRDYRVTICGTDTIWPRLFIRAGYDGRAFWASLGFYRDLCKNLSMIQAAGKSHSANIHHTAKLTEKLADLTDTFAELASGWTDLVATARRMAARPVNLANFLRTVYPLAADASPRTVANADARISAIVGRIVREYHQTHGAALVMGNSDTFSVSAWQAFNGVQGYVQHEQRRNGKPDNFRRAILTFDDYSVERAMVYALSA